MRILVTCKIVPDDQDVQVAGDGSLDFSRAHQVVSTYDLNAIEAAAQLAAANEGSYLAALSAGSSKIDDSKTKKNILARGVDELFMACDERCADMDAHATAAVLADLAQQAGPWDLIVCGDGSADNYAQQVDVQLAAILGVPVVNGAVSLSVEGGALKVERVLEDVVEVVEVPLPAVVSVSPDIAVPRIAGMKDILAAGKKPMHVDAAADVPSNVVETVECKAPEQKPRRQEILDASQDGALEAFAAALKAAL